MDEKEKLIFFYYDHLQAVRRAQKHYLALLLALLGFVWVLYWNRSADSSASLLGMPLSDKSLLGVTPGLSTILLLGLIGSWRAVHPALHLLREAWNSAGGATKLELEAIDSQQNWADYTTFIWGGPFGYFIYAAVLLAVIASTFAVGLTLNPEFKGYSTFLFTTYCLLCLAVQAVASWKWIAERISVSRHQD
jgi:hypothetical protein